MNWLWKSLVAIGSAAIVVFLVWQDMQSESGGEISAVHAQVAELEDGAACDACHGDGDTTLKSACLQCHETIAEQLVAGEGLHAELDEQTLEGCGGCHLEHVGRDYDLSGERSFRLSGFPGPDGFDHSYAQFDLHGKHQQLKCEDCHPNAEKQPLPAGESRYLGQVQACEHCHDDPHNGAMKRECEDCHGQSHPFTDLTSFEHHQQFPLHASHSGLKCADCHEAQSSHSVEALSGEVDFSAWRSCSQCHDSPHSSDFTQGTSCEDCHSEQHTSFSGSEASVSVEQHAASGFLLESPHQDLGCEKCHGAGLGTSFAARFPGRSAERCRQCHQDPHSGQFDHEPYLERDCLSCHHQDRFQPHHFDVDQHEQTAYPLLHSHRQVECSKCHASGHFADTTQRCKECHSDAHRGAFDSFHQASINDASQAQDGGECAECHRPSKFRDLTQAFEHERWTHFQLQGAHAKLDCEGCHSRTEADTHGRTFGWASAMHDGDPAACGGCHSDLHRGVFNAQGLPAEYQGKRGCARCHNAHSFAAEPGQSLKFDHALWAKFPLEGAHKQATCISCHGSGDREQPPRRLGTLQHRYGGNPQLCRSCHQDPHDGLFEQSGSSGCEQCHNNLSFRHIDPPFDHDKWTSFALRGEHQKLKCVDCHPHLAKPDSLGRSTARAAGNQCHQCHADVHAGQFAENGRTSCQSCHREDQAAFLIPDFDHQSQTQYPLDETHRKVQCNQCHPRWELEGGGSAVRYRGTPTQCQDCHQVVPKQGGKR